MVPRPTGRFGPGESPGPASRPGSNGLHGRPGAGTPEVANDERQASAPAASGRRDAMSGPQRDIAALPDLLHGHAGAGPVRTSRPVYLDLLPPCNAGCPAGENIQAWLAHMQAGRPEQAWRQLVQDNPMPAIHGRVCYHPCESVCNRADLDSAVSIHGVERFLGDLALERGWRFDPPPAPTGRRVLVVGAGPSGLSAAYHLARLGHQVEIRDASPEPGGMMRYGIPSYRLPREVLTGEIDRIAALGVRISCGHRVADLAAEMRGGAGGGGGGGGFDAAFVAVGAHLSKRVDIPARDAGRIVDAVAFLRSVASGERPVIGRRVAVYGGGNTAMDAARTARRLGADDALIVYRRTRAQMPAHEEEAEDAEREGVRINWLRTITAFDGPDLTVEVMELDGSGRPHGTGRFETLAADTVILALGQSSESAFMRQLPGVEFTGDGNVVVSPSLMTGCPGVFAGGDMVPSERTVTVGVGHGKKAARQIDGYLHGAAAQSPAKHEVVHFDALHPWYFGDAARRSQPELDLAARVRDFTEVVGGLDATQAGYEAGRCLSCGNCFECDGCLGSCPEDAVIKLGTGHRYRFDYNRCTGCGACYEQCPVHAIEMVVEGQ
jgi:NADPH-dependent glutamate synthase beta subunit-like oxidoreductase